jgi:predicted negative regulator of RcsB-dependent stress response
VSRCKVHRIMLLFCFTLRCLLDAFGSQVWSGTAQQQQQSAAVVWEQLSKPGKGANAG